MEIFKLFGSIMVDSSKAEQSIAKTEQKAEGLGSKLGRGIATAGKWGLAIGGAAVAVGAAVGGIAMKSADAAGALDDISQRTGMAAEEYQKYAYAAKLSGIETETLEKAMIKQQKAFADAKTGSKSMGEAYKALGIDINTVGSSSEAFDQVIGKLADMEDITQRDALANDIFGKSYAELAPLLNEGAAGIDKLKQEAVDMGAVMSEDAVKAGAKLGDTMDSLKMAGKGMALQIGSELIPHVQKFADWIIKHMPQIKQFVKQAFDIIGKAVQTGMDVFDALLPVLEPLWDFIKWAFPLITSAISSTFKTIKPLIEGVGKVFGALADSIQWAYDKWMKWIGREDDKKLSLAGDEQAAGRGGGGSRSKASIGHASGLAYVPYDGYEATLHKGERVLSRGEVSQAQTVNHTGTITVKGVNSRDELIGVTQILARDIAENDRRMPNRARLVPIG